MIDTNSIKSRAKQLLPFVVGGIAITLTALSLVNNYKYSDFLRKADLELRLNNSEGFLEHIDNALKVNPAGSVALFGSRASYFFQTKKYKESIQDYEKAISLGMEEASSYFNMARAYFAIKNYSRSINAYDESLRLGSKALAAIYFNKGLSYLELEDYEKAEKNFALYVEQKPGESDGYIMRAKSHLRAVLINIMMLFKI